MGITSSQVYDLSKKEDPNSKLIIDFAATLLELFISNSHLSEHLSEPSSQDGLFIFHHSSQKNNVPEPRKRLGSESQMSVSRAWLLSRRALTLIIWNLKWETVGFQLKSMNLSLLRVASIYNICVIFLFFHGDWDNGTASQYNGFHALKLNEAVPADKFPVTLISLARICDTWFSFLTGHQTESWHCTAPEPAICTPLKAASLCHSSSSSLWFAISW